MIDEDVAYATCIPCHRSLEAHVWKTHACVCICVDVDLLYNATGRSSEGFGIVFRSSLLYRWLLPHELVQIDKRTSLGQAYEVGHLYFGFGCLALHCKSPQLHSFLPNFRCCGHTQVCNLRRVLLILLH